MTIETIETTEDTFFSDRRRRLLSSSQLNVRFNFNYSSAASTDFEDVDFAISDSDW